MDENDVIPAEISSRRCPALIRAMHLAFFAAALSLAGCGGKKTGPVSVSAIGGAPALENPNDGPLDPPSALLAEATAQGLVRFEAQGQIEPALAERWIVSDDGLRYTFRIADTTWDGGGEVTASQVVARLRAAGSGSSRNPLRPLLGAIDDIDAMTDDVIEIGIKGPRPYFLQMLAQPELAIVRNGAGTGPYRATRRADGSLLLRLPRHDDEDEAPKRPDILLRGERAALAVARFQNGHADLVSGGTAGDLPIARAATLASQTLRFDPVAGLFGLAFTARSGPLAKAEVRQALSMVIDRDQIVTALAVPDLQPRQTIVPTGIDELPDPQLPVWAAMPMPQRRSIAAPILARVAGGQPLRLRVAAPDRPGYRLILAHLRRDWRPFNVELIIVDEKAAADLRLLDAVAPAAMASWYLRSFSCAVSAVCSEEADQALDQARLAPDPAMRRQMLGQADRIMEDAGLFIPIAAPVRWYLVSRRLTGFTPNPFGRHPFSGLIRETGGGSGG